MATNPSQSQRQEIDESAKYFSRLERREGLTKEDEMERYYASWGGLSGWRPKGYTYVRRPLPPSNPSDPDDSEDTEPEQVTSKQVNRKRPRDDNEEPLNAAYESDGTTYIRRAKKIKTCRVQIAKPLIRPRLTISPPLTNSDDSSSDSSGILLESRENKEMTPKGPIFPPHSPKVPWVSDFQHLSDNITPASLRDYMMSGYHDCFLGEEANIIILGEWGME